jgi:hypothetical protein
VIYIGHFLIERYLGEKESHRIIAKTAKEEEEI